jgi:hypothetical protein
MVVCVGLNVTDISFLAGGLARLFGGLDMGLLGELQQISLAAMPVAVRRTVSQRLLRAGVFAFAQISLLPVILAHSLDKQKLTFRC